MTLNEHDCVEAVKDIPEKNITKGMKGVIIHIFNQPHLAYEIEFFDESGEPVEQAALLPEQIVKVGL